MMAEEESAAEAQQPDVSLTTAIEAMAAVREPDRLVEIVLEILVRALQADGARLFGARGGDIALLRHLGRSTGGPELPPPGAAEKALAARVLASGSAVAVEDTAAARDHDPGGPGALALAPLHASGQLLGVVSVAYASPRELGAALRDRLAVIAGAAAVALAGAKVEEENVALRLRLQRLQRASLDLASSLSIVPEAHMRAAVRRGMRLWQPSPAVAGPEFLRPVLQSISEHARAVTGAGLAAIGIGECPDRRFDPWVQSGVAPDEVEAIGRQPRPIGLLGAVVEEGRAIRLDDRTHHPAHLASLPDHHPAIGSFLGVPIRYKERTLGNLYLANKPGGFTLEDEQAVEAFASQIGVVLQQAYLRAAVEVQHSGLESILESAPVGILFIDAATGDLTANPRAMELLGAPILPEEGVAQYGDLIHHPDGRPLPPEERPSAQALSGRAVHAEELLVVRPDGRRIQVLSNADAVRGLDDQILGAVVLFEDISALKELEQLREQFAAMVAHDLRTPVQTILLEAGRLMIREERGEVRAPAAAVRRIRDCAVRLAHMAGDLLEMARLELSRVPLEKAAVDAATIVARVVDEVRPTLEPHPVGVIVEGTPVPIDVDVRRFEQIVGNLLDNAVKYSPPEAPIDVIVAPSEGGALVTVRDRGIGIAANELPHVFDRFYQSQRGREKTGLGVGLYITKGLVEAHGGRITVESEVGRGTAIHVWLPRAGGGVVGRAA